VAKGKRKKKTLVPFARESLGRTGLTSVPKRIECPEIGNRAELIRRQKWDAQKKRKGNRKGEKTEGGAGGQGAREQGRESGIRKRNDAAGDLRGMKGKRAGTRDRSGRGFLQFKIGTRFCEPTQFQKVQNAQKAQQFSSRTDKGRYTFRIPRTAGR